MATATAPAVDSGRPTITVDGQDVPALIGGLLDLLVEETADGLYRCEARFGSWGATGSGAGLLHLDRRTLDFGKAFSVKLDRDVLFDGRITGLEATFPPENVPELTVLAEDRLQDLRMTRRTVVYENLTDAQIVDQVASRHGLRTQVSLSGPQHRAVVQLNQSDLAFVRRRAAMVGGEVWFADGTLFAKERRARGGSLLKLELHGGLREFTVLADLAGQRTSVVVSGWDPAAKQAIRHEATVSVVSPELEGGYVSGPAVLQSALGDRKESLVHAVPLSAAEAQARAESQLRATARRFVVGRGTARTDPALRVGARVQIAGLGGLFSGKYDVTGVRHLYDGTEGLRTQFTVERAGLGPP